MDRVFEDMMDGLEKRADEASVIEVTSPSLGETEPEDEEDEEQCNLSSSEDSCKTFLRVESAELKWDESEVCPSVAWEALREGSGEGVGEANESSSGPL